MNKVITYLEKLNFSENEAKMYIALLKKGSMTISELAKNANINRTAAYAHVNALLEKGVIAKSKGVSNKVFANPPEQLHNLVEEKLSEANIIKEQLFPIVTTLNSSFMSARTSVESDIKYFKGRKGVKSIYSDALKSKEIRAYYNPAEIEQYFPENVELFMKTLLKNPGMKVYEIVEDSKEAYEHIKVGKAAPGHIWKFLPPDIKLTSNDILIYDGKVAIINLLGPDNFHGSILENKDYYNNSKQLFDLLWRLLPEPSGA